MLNEEEKKYLRSTRLSVKINYAELEDNYDDGNIFYYYGKGIVISTINSETYIDKNYYTEERLINLLNDIFSCLDTTELILPEEFFTVDIIKKTFKNLNCNVIIIDGKNKINLNQLNAINETTNIKELKVPDIEKDIGTTRFNFKIIPNINNQFTSEKFSSFIIDDILRLKALDIELPLKDDYVDENNKQISENNDLEKIIDVLVDIDALSLTILDDGSVSIPQAFDIIQKIERSIGSKIENTYFITGNRDIENIDLIKKLEIDHKVSIMYDKETICSVDDFINMRNWINKLIEPIKKCSLSPLERALYAYDTVKDFYIINHKYMQEKKISRLIHRIFKANELNCQAYSALYAQILRELKIQAADYFLYSPLVEEVFLTKDNHSRLIIHLIDDKYKIDGLFSTDVVWDAIKKMKKNYHYEFFLTKAQNLKKQFVTDKFPNEIEVILGNKTIAELPIKEQQFFERLLNKDIITDKNIEKLKQILPNNISLKIFLCALSAVRVAQGIDKQIIKDELVAIVNRNSKKEKYTDVFSDSNKNLDCLDINTNKKDS